MHKKGKKHIKNYFKKQQPKIKVFFFLYNF